MILGTSINSKLAVVTLLVLGNMGIPAMRFLVSSNK